MSLRAARPYAWSAVLHVGVLALLGLGASFTKPEAVQPVPIEAVIVDASVIEALALERRVGEQRRERERRARLEKQRLEAEVAAREAQHPEQVEQATMESQRQAEADARRQAEVVAADKKKAEAAPAVQVAAAATVSTGRAARFVRVELPGGKRILTLAEVEVFSGGKNIARTGKATQSSDGGGAASRGIDGNKSPDWGKGGQTHTSNSGTTNPWWELDLGTAAVIEKVGIWNRSGYENRLDGFTLTLLDADRKEVFRAASIAAPQGMEIDVKAGGTLAYLNYGPRLGEIRTPTLVICGDEDHGAPPENSRQMHAMISGSRFAVGEQAGHISNIEKPAIFNGSVASLFDDVENGQRAS